MEGAQGQEGGTPGKRRSRRGRQAQEAGVRCACALCGHTAGRRTYLAVDEVDERKAAALSCGRRRWGRLGEGMVNNRQACTRAGGRATAPARCAERWERGAARGRTRFAVLGHKDALDGAKGPKQLRQVLLRHVLAQVAHAHAATARGTGHWLSRVKGGRHQAAHGLGWSMQR